MSDYTDSFPDAQNYNTYSARVNNWVKNGSLGNAPAPPPSSTNSYPDQSQPRGGDYTPQASASAGPIETGRGGDYNPSEYRGEWQAPRVPSKPLAFNPEAYRQYKMNAYSDPNDWNARTNAYLQEYAFAQNVRRIGGGNPTYGFTPNGPQGQGKFYNLLNGFEVNPDKLDPYTRLFGNIQMNNPNGLPTFAQTGGRGGVFGRGYHMGASQGGYSPQDIQLYQRATNGDIGAARALAQSRQWKGNDLSSMQKIARQYYLPTLMAIGGLAAGGTTGIPAMLSGAGWGAFTSGVADKFQHPWAIGLGAAGGLAGSYGAGQLSGVLKASPAVAGAIGGVGSTLGRTAGETIGGRPWNTSNFIRDIALSGGAGAVGGAITGRGSVSPEGKPIPPTAGEKVLGNLGGNAARTIGGLVWPAQAPPRPQAPQETEAQRRKRLALSQQQMNPYK